MIKTATRGPWSGGYTSSVPAFMARPDQLTGQQDGSDTNSSRDVNIDPFTGGVYKRAGCSVVDDTLSSGASVTGLLNKKLNFRCRALTAFDTPSMTSGYAVIGALYGYDSNPGFPSTDTGFPGTFYVNSTNATALTSLARNYSLLEEFLNNGSYSNSPAAKAVATDYALKVVPIWVESGAGLYNRGALTGTAGTDPFLQQFLTCGSRAGLNTQNWYYAPNLRATPWRWNKRLNENVSSITQTVRIYPTGPLPPLHPGVATVSAASANDSSWVDGDTFFHSVIFQFEDGSYSLPFLPRAVNTTLTSGLGFKTVGTIGGTNKYKFITHSNIPIGPEGTIARILLRTTKQNRTAAGDAVTVEATDLRVIGRLGNNTQTSYINYAGDDNSLLEDPDVVRLDWVMPRRSRYIGTGDQRALISYTLPNTASILLAPVGINAAYDRNSLDTSSNCYGTVGSYIRITSTQLELHYNAGAAANFAGAGNATAFTFATYDTLEKMVDAINATTVASNCRQWAAQMAPGIDGTMSSASLTPTTQDFSCTTDGTTTIEIGTAADHLMIPVGAEVKGTGITAGTYIKSKSVASGPTRYLCLMSAVSTVSSTVARTFYSNTGDEGFVDTAAATKGYLRAFSATFPVLLHMQASSLGGYDTPDKTSVYFTVSSPGAAASGVSLAPNSWVAGNRRQPHLSPSQTIRRTCMGIVDIDSAAVIAYSDGIFLFQNRKGGISGEDEDQRLYTVNDTRGCISYLSLVSGNGWAAYCTPQGVIVVDKNAREFAVSGDIFNPSDMSGDLAYEITQSSASAASDSDNQYLSMAIMGSKLAVGFRGSNTYTRLCFYDFSPGIEASGVEQLLNPETKSAYIWSPPHIYNSTFSIGLTGAMGSVYGASGRSDYLSYDDNAGATGDGRIELIQTGTTDNNSAVTSYAQVAPLVPEPYTRVSAQDMEVTHRTTAASGINSIELANDQTPTFNTSLSRLLAIDAAKLQYQKQRVPIDRGQAGPADIFWMRWKSTATSVLNRIYRIVLRYQESEL